MFDDLFYILKCFMICIVYVFVFSFINVTCKIWSELISQLFRIKNYIF